MNIDYFISGLESSGKKLELFLSDISPEQAVWKPHPDKWSVNEVVNHLYDEERDDFRKRLDLTLFHSGEEWPGFDPEGRVREREYNKRDFLQSATNFLGERKKSLQWLKKLTNADFSKYYQHPIFGQLAAGDLLASWLCHDYLHLRQLANLQSQYLDVIAKPFSTRYAAP